MSDLGNKNVFANNLKYYLDMFNKDRKQVCKDLNIKYSTLSEWINANKYPRIDKIELLANYFGILKSDLIEDKKANEKTNRNNVIIYHKNGKKEQIVLSDNKMNMFLKMIEAFKDDNSDL